MLPADLLPVLANWGFPASLSLYLLWRADRLLTPLVTEAMGLIRETSKAMMSVSERLGGLVDRVDEGTERVLGDHADIHAAVSANSTILARIETTMAELLRRTPQRKETH